MLFGSGSSGLGRSCFAGARLVPKAGNSLSGKPDVKLTLGRSSMSIAQQVALLQRRFFKRRFFPMDYPGLCDNARRENCVPDDLVRLPGAPPIIQDKTCL